MATPPPAPWPPWSRATPPGRSAPRRPTALPGLGLILVGLIDTLAYAAFFGWVLLLALGQVAPPERLQKWNDERIADRSPGVAYLAVNGFTAGTAIHLVLLGIGVVL